MVDLTPTARAYMIGRCGDSAPMAEAVCRVLIQGHAARLVAREERVPRRTLHRRVREVREGLKALIVGGHVEPAQLMAG